MPSTGPHHDTSGEARQARIVDLRLVLDRDDRVRVYLDGARVPIEPATVADALRALADLIDGEPAEVQLGALASAIARHWPPPDPLEVAARERAERRREHARALYRDAGRPVPAWLGGQP
ncbi:MAG: hypothetical protein M5U28_36040 [Sandaracinaceae bacterium]|nr:hypothetical protein [Sandaracinaceae bacterium]